MSIVKRMVLGELTRSRELNGRCVAGRELAAGQAGWMAATGEPT